MPSPDAAEAALRRRFITPEGVDLRIGLASAGSRAGAFLLDGLFMFLIMIVATIAIGYLANAMQSVLMEALWLIGLFLLRNGWFTLFEMGARGATPGKRITGLRVVARDGARLTGGAVIMRNAMREIEFFLPFTFFLASLAAVFTGGDILLPLLALLWSGIFLFFPIFNRDRLRVGDLLAGTWVVRVAKQDLGADLMARDSVQPRRTFSAEALNLYGVYELQTLESVLRHGRSEALFTVADAIRRKAGLPDDGDDYGFLSDYYTALCAHLERGLMVGKRRASKHD